MKKAKILVVAPYEGMRELLTGIADQRQDVDLTIMNCSIKDINQLMSNPERLFSHRLQGRNRQADQGADAPAGRGDTDIGL